MTMDDRGKRRRRPSLSVVAWSSGTAPAESSSRAKRGDRDYRMPTFFFFFFCIRFAPDCMLYDEIIKGSTCATERAPRLL